MYIEQYLFLFYIHLDNLVIHPRHFQPICWSPLWLNELQACVQILNNEPRCATIHNTWHSTKSNLFMKLRVNFGKRKHFRCTTCNFITLKLYVHGRALNGSCTVMMTDGLSGRLPVTDKNCTGAFKIGFLWRTWAISSGLVWRCHPKAGRNRSAGMLMQRVSIL